MTNPQFFDNLISPHRSMQQVEQPSSAGPWNSAISTQSIWNDLEATDFSAPGRMPVFLSVLFHQPELLQRSKRRRSLG
jgi:hypothetical protein